MHSNWDGCAATNAGGPKLEEVSGNLPTEFGFVIDFHDPEPETIYIVPPIKSDGRTLPLEGKCGLLPQQSPRQRREALPRACANRLYVNVTAHAMAGDSTISAGVYFCTTGGQVYGSRRRGDKWFSHRGTPSPAVL